MPPGGPRPNAAEPSFGPGDQWILLRPDAVRSTLKQCVDFGFGLQPVLFFPTRREAAALGVKIRRLRNHGAPGLDRDARGRRG